MRTPTVHMNGTAPEQLLEQLTDAYRAVGSAMHALDEAAPNGRDYYPQGHEAVQEATREHRRRADKLLSVHAELEELVTSVQDQIDVIEEQRTIRRNSTLPTSQETISFTHIRLDEDMDEYQEEIARSAYNLFEQRGIRLHSNYDEIIVDLKGMEVAGAAAVSVYPYDESIEFSISVAPSHERRGLGRRLTLAVIDLTQNYADEYGWEAPRVEGHVVNQTAIPPLLRSLGFEPFEEDPNRWKKHL